ncbi:MAG: 1-acyl-sn-glycerol-3-phosphate acyltransferase [Halobacteriovoraceae bacterium]|nr:1-acyl-sn-glycerol-3-phosphate acyltransferase [Halobacteriovoraceae bacterium]MCB9094135.1 1-acyl-sn-glycerol-3-phosphate acyltransferase [Halobacteriovoraceae bacterium]
MRTDIFYDYDKKVKFLGYFFIIFKSIIIFINVLAYVFTSVPFYPFYKVYPHKTKRILNKILHFYCKFLCFLLNIKITVKNQEVIDSHQNYLFVGNHLSYLDIFIASAVYPLSFITSFEMKETPFIGWLCEIAGTVFVERRNKSNREKELWDIENALKHGVDIVLYAEATSTNGEKVLPFRRPMFEPAIKNNVPVMTMVLNYKKLNGHDINLNNRDQLFWYGDMPLLPHLLNVLTLQSIEVEFEFLQCVETHDIETTNHIVEITHDIVAKHYQPIIS